MEQKSVNQKGGKENFLRQVAHVPLTFGQRAADSLAKWAGSWTFIITFFIFLLLWMLANVYAWTHEWDPYPFILLNLVLSCLAAIQAPVILMSQNRQSQKDRIKAEYDYSVNRRSERGIEEVLKRLDRIERKVNFGDARKNSNTSKK